MEFRVCIWCFFSCSYTYKSVLVRDVVGELELVERDELLHPLLARTRRIRMNVHPFGHFRVGFASHHPA